LVHRQPAVHCNKTGAAHALVSACTGEEEHIGPRDDDEGEGDKEEEDDGDEQALAPRLLP
jgi:hypothetical protein